MRHSKSIPFLLIMNFVFYFWGFAQNVTITDDESNSADNSAMLDVKSTDKGMLIPRIDFNDKPASPATGLLVYVTANGPDGNNAFYYYNDADWVKIISVGAETDPVFITSIAAGISGSDTTSWNNKLESETQNFADVAAVNNSVNAQLKNVTDPSDAQDVATKAYIDEMLINAGKLTVKDYDGNIYQTVKIGTQVWMAENLRTTNDADGTTLIDGSDSTDINGDNTTNYYFWYDNDSATYAETYGALYTWPAVMNGSVSSSSNPSGVQGVCPDGWHIPSDEEWKEMEMYLGMSQSEADGTGWRGTNEGSKLASNADLWVDGDLEGDEDFSTSGFIALPGGYRYYEGSFTGFGQLAGYWSTTENTSSSGWIRSLSWFYSEVNRDATYNWNGYSVRCVKD